MQVIVKDILLHIIIIIIMNSQIIIAKSGEIFYSAILNFIKSMQGRYFDIIAGMYV